MKNYTFPKWTELPEIDLYMDQVITYINEKLKDTYFYDEKFITKAMINNYVKTDGQEKKTTFAIHYEFCPCCECHRKLATRLLNIA